MGVVTKKKKRSRDISVYTLGCNVTQFDTKEMYLWLISNKQFLVFIFIFWKCNKNWWSAARGQEFDSAQRAGNHHHVYDLLTYWLLISRPHLHFFTYNILGVDKLNSIIRITYTFYALEFHIIFWEAKPNYYASTHFSQKLEITKKNK